jgi:hypothetical protein
VRHRYLRRKATAEITDGHIIIRWLHPITMQNDEVVTVRTTAKVRCIETSGGVNGHSKPRVSRGQDTGRDSP